jgi:hypothetical protein
MSSTVSASSGHYSNRHTLRFSRTQREAGLEWFDWENRLRPLSHDIANIAIGVIAAAAIVLGFSLI